MIFLVTAYEDKSGDSTTVYSYEEVERAVSALNYFITDEKYTRVEIEQTTLEDWQARIS